MITESVPWCSAVNSISGLIFSHVCSHTDAREGDEGHWDGDTNINYKYYYYSPLNEPSGRPQKTGQVGPGKKRLSRGFVKMRANRVFWEDVVNIPTLTPAPLPHNAPLQGWDPRGGQSNAPLGAHDGPISKVRGPTRQTGGEENLLLYFVPWCFL